MGMEVCKTNFRGDDFLYPVGFLSILPRGRYPHCIVEELNPIGDLVASSWYSDKIILNGTRAVPHGG